MKHGGGADARAKVLGIGGDRQQCLGGGAKQEVVDDRLVLVGDRRDLVFRRGKFTPVRGDRRPILTPVAM